MSKENAMDNSLQQDEKELKKARIKMIARYGLLFLAWTVAALGSIGLLVFVVLFMMGRV